MPPSLSCLCFVGDQTLIPTYGAKILASVTKAALLFPNNFNWIIPRQSSGTSSTHLCILIGNSKKYSRFIDQWTDSHVTAETKVSTPADRHVSQYMANQTTYLIVGFATANNDWLMMELMTMMMMTADHNDDEMKAEMSHAKMRGQVEEGDDWTRDRKSFHFFLGQPSGDQRQCGLKGERTVQGIQKIQGKVDHLGSWGTGCYIDC